MREGGLHYSLSHYLMTSYPNFITDDYNIIIIIQNAPKYSWAWPHPERPGWGHAQLPKRTKSSYRNSLQHSFSLSIYISLVNNFATHGKIIVSAKKKDFDLK